MKRLTSIVIATMLVACGKTGGSGGGSSGGPVPVPDTTPHDYATRVFSPDGATSTATIHQVCNFGRPGLRDETANVNITPVQITGGAGCGGVSNYTSDVTITGAAHLYLEIDIDGVWHPELEKDLLPGQTYTFQRGF